MRVLLALVEAVGLLLGADGSVALGALYNVRPFDLTKMSLVLKRISYLVTSLVGAAGSDVGRHVDVVVRGWLLVVWWLL